MSPSAGQQHSSDATHRVESLLRGWWMFAVGAGSAIVFFMCGVVLGIYLGVVPLLGSDSVAFPHASLWMWSLTGLTVSMGVLLGWLTRRVLNRPAPG